jgi:hypothetical protein
MSTPAKPHLYYLVAPVQLVPMPRELAVKLGDGGEAERLNFSIPVCTVADPATIVAYGGGTGPAGEQTRQYLDSQVLLGLPPQVLWVRCVNEAAPPRIVRTSHAPTQARIDGGEVVRWDLGRALTAVGLALWRDPALQLPLL